MRVLLRRLVILWVTGLLIDAVIWRFEIAIYIPNFYFGSKLTNREAYRVRCGDTTDKRGGSKKCFAG